MTEQISSWTDEGPGPLSLHLNSGNMSLAFPSHFASNVHPEYMRHGQGKTPSLKSNFYLYGKFVTPKRS